MVLLSLGSALYPAGTSARLLNGPFRQYVSKFVSMYCAGCPVTFSNAAARLRLHHMLNSSTSRSMPIARALRMVEQPANIIAAILKSDMRYGSLTKAELST